MKCIRSASIALDAFGRKKRKKEKKTIFLDPLERIAFKGHPWKKKTITSAVLIYMLALKGEGSVVAGSVRYRLLDDGKKNLTPAGLRNYSVSYRQEEQDAHWEALYWHSIILRHGGCVTLLS